MKKTVKKILLCVFLAGAMSIVAAAADVSGRWTGSFTPDGGESHTAFFVLKQNGNAIAGTAGPEENQQWPDLKGTIHGDKVTLEVKSPEDGMTYKCDLLLAGDRLKGDVTATPGGGGEALKGKVDVARVK